MNKRIKELVGEAKFMAEESINMKISANESLYAFAEEFAELIIKECVSVINTEAAEHEDDEYERAWKMGTEFAVYQIKEHFGVDK